MKGRELTIERCMSSLKRKGCSYIPPTPEDPSKYLDISGSRGLGKASWGMIDFMRRQGVYIVGMVSYFEKGQGG